MHTVEVCGLIGCRDRPRRKVVGIVVDKWYVCCCWWCLFVVFVEAVLFVVVGCWLLELVQFVFDGVAKALIGVLLCCRFGFARLCWYCCSWVHHRCRVVCNVVSSIFPIVRLWPMSRLRLLRLYIFFVVVPMAV